MRINLRLRNVSFVENGFKVLLFVFSTICVGINLKVCRHKLQSPASFTSVLSQNDKDLTCMMRSLHSSYNSNTSDHKRCFMLSWGVQTSRDIVERNLNCAKNVYGKIEGNFETNDVDARETRANSCKRFIRIKKFRGRMGNHIFAVASLIGMAYKYDVIPIFFDNLQLFEYFSMPNQITENSWQRTDTCVPLKSASYYNCSHEIDSLGRNITIQGYMQSWRYFEDVRDIIRNLFRFGGNRELRVRKYLSSISKEGHERVCIHVRRTDMADSGQIEIGYNVAENDYFERARKVYENEFSKVQFIVATDDKTWCRENLSDLDISPFEDPGDDLALLTMCDHVIITGGTFGWWGAWLSGGTTVYFKGYPRPGSWLDSQTNRTEYYPPDWIGIS